MDISGDTLNDLHQAVLRAKSGDRKAFDLLYTAYLTPVYRYIHIRVKNSQDTEDIVQETFLKAFQAIERYRDEKGSMLPYLFTIARNLLINHGKKKRPDAFLPEEMDRFSDDNLASEGAVVRERKELLEQAMLVLTDVEREVIQLRFFGEQTYTEIALVLGKREDAIRQHVARALKKMKATMKET